jgi:hypothetical protein
LNFRRARNTPAEAASKPRPERFEARIRQGGAVMMLSKAQLTLSIVLQLVAAGILLQTLFFKFTGAEESVYIFSTLGVEPWGRLASGVVELIGAVLLLVPGTAAIGAVVACGVMAGAIMSHLTILGIEVRGDGGLLFALALVVLVSSAVVVILRRADLPIVGRYLGMAV